MVARALWGGTGDLDLLGYGDAVPQHIAQVFRGLCEVDVPDDGVTFDPDTVRAELARADDEYSGVRITLTATIAVAELPIQIDIGFGDVVTPGVAEAVYPSLLDLPEPRLRAYPPETVVAEKLEALVSLGVRNTRMKDFYDLWAIAITFAFDGATLARALRATFAKRQTPFPDGQRFGLTAAFSGAPDEQALWRVFLARTTINHAPAPLRELIDFIAAFALPLLAPSSVDDLAVRDWPAGGPWQGAAPTKSSAAPASGEG